MEQPNIQANEAPVTEQSEPLAPQEVAVSSLITPKANAESKQTGAESTQKPQQTRNGGAQTAPEPRIDNQTDFNKILGLRLNDERTKVGNTYKATPQYSLGEELIRERMQVDGVTAEEAARRIRNERAGQKAKDAKADPEKFYRDFYAQQGADTAQTPQKNAPAEHPAGSSVADDLVAAVNAGTIPAGFLPEHVDEFFVNDANAYGVDYALRRWESMHPNAHAAQQQAAPRQQPAAKPMRVSGADATPRPLSFTTDDMDSAQFADVLKKMDAAQARGESVVFR